MVEKCFIKIFLEIIYMPNQNLWEYRIKKNNYIKVKINSNL